MCLLIAGPSNTIRNTLLNTEGLLHDIFDSNSDGVGAMYTTSKNKLRTPKVLPKNLGECIAFIRQLPDDDRNLALHFRMRTHGDTNLENCHPYTVLDDKIAMMHNGVLQHGNKADTSKSDTWHYINNTVRPVLAEAPKLFVNTAWMRLVEEDIGSGNRFAIMDHTGDLAILNKHTGLMVNDTMWFSNTYAWSPELLIPGYRKPAAFYPTKWGRGCMVDDDEGFAWPVAGAKSMLPASPKPRNKSEAPAAANSEGVVGGTMNETLVDEVWEAVRYADTALMADLLEQAPFTVLNILLAHDQFDPASSYKNSPEEYSELDKEIIEDLVAGRVVALRATVNRDAAHAERVAEAICWYGDWVGKSTNAKGESADPVLPGVDTVQMLERIGAALDAENEASLSRATKDTVAAHAASEIVDEVEEERERLARQDDLRRELAVAMSAGDITCAH